MLCVSCVVPVPFLRKFTNILVAHQISRKRKLSRPQQGQHITTVHLCVSVWFLCSSKLVTKFQEKGSSLDDNKEYGGGNTYTAAADDDCGMAKCCVSPVWFLCHS